MTCVVVSQPMYFPWYGFLEQYNRSDTFVYYDDVQYSKGSFTNRVQIKTPGGIRWLTVPLDNFRLGQKINEVAIDNRKDWRRSQFDLLRQAYSGAPFRDDVLDLVEDVFKNDYENIGLLAQASTEALIRYFPSVGQSTSVFKSSLLGINGSSTQRVVDICCSFNASIYLTGHGARHYLEYEKFEAHGIDVAYIDYGLSEYPQGHGAFTPYVSTLDLIANCGPSGIEHIQGRMLPWRAFVARMTESKAD